jgi:capsular exopolysaccharide synthesis family protein
MPRPSAGDVAAGASSSPYHTPPIGMPLPANQPVPLNYAGQPVPPAPAAKASPTPAGLFNAFRRRWVLGTFVGLLVSASVALTVWLLMPGGKHEARGLIRLRDREGDIAFKNSEDYESYRRNQVFILKTRALLQRTVNEPAVASLGTVRASDDPARAVEENLQVTLAAPQVLAVTLKGNNLDDMKTIVDALMQKYLEEAANYDRTDRDEQLKKYVQIEQTLKDDIEATERRLKIIVRGTGATAGESNEKRLAELQKQIADEEAEISQTEKRVAKMEADRLVARKQLEAGKPAVDQVALRLIVGADPRIIPLARDVTDAELQLEKDIKTATDPDTSEVVKADREALAKAKAALGAATKKVSGELEEAARSRALLALREKIIELDAKIASDQEYRENRKSKRDSLQRMVVGGAENNFEARVLEQELEPKREALGKVQVQLMNLRNQRALDSRARILEEAQPLPNNNLAKKLVLAGGAGMGTFAVVVLLVAFLEWRTRRVDGVDQVVGELGMRILGTVPAFPNRASLAAAAEAGGANWRFSLNESINSTRTLLLHSARAQSMQVVMVTSATQGEGKTSLASQLASSMATAGMRTLIVDCDLRNPSIHKLFDLGLTAGVSEILTQDADVSDAIQPTAVPNLWVISAGQCSNRVIAALAQGHPLETLFNRLRGQFDFVIVDSCPVLPVADALLVGQHVDGVVFSIMQDVSQLPKVLVASEKLTQLNIPLLGAVVNGIKQDVYSYGYNYVKQLPA